MAKASMGQTSLDASDYVHLHNHTQYSLLDGLSKVPAMVEFAKTSGMKALAVTDHGTLSGVIEFYKQANELNIKPIIGIETYVASRTLSDKDPIRDKQYYHLILLAMNNQGYQNLMRLSTIANLEGLYYKPRIDHQLLAKYNQGLIVLSGCIGSEVSDLLRQNQYAGAKQVASWYKKTFGDRYYLELQDHGHPKHPTFWVEQQLVNEQLLKLGRELDIECLLTCDAHYLKHEDQEAHEILLCVQTGSYLSDPKRLSLKNLELHLTEPEEIIKRWAEEEPQLITNTKKIADRCQVEIDLGNILLPKFPLPDGGESERIYLEKLVYRGLSARFGNQTEAKAVKLSISAAQKTLPPAVLERAKYELDVIEQMGFNAYFLIISDFINWGKNQGIVFGPGRGSAAGSIIAYGLKITELNPLDYDLLFERFLNPDRISMPDIDIDIQDNRRQEVIQYCIGKYGSDRVASIVTFGRMAARNAVRDVARVLEVPYAEADRLAKMIPPPTQGRHIPLSVSVKENYDLKREYQSNPLAKRVFDLAFQLEGTIRSHGVHAAGVVIAPKDIVLYTPLEMAQKGVVATQYSMGPIEELGLLKMDFLGLSNLTIIKNALRIIKRVYQKDIDINLLPLDDHMTYQLFQSGDTTGVFQLESSGMKRYLKQLKPTAFEDIIAMVALYRPGPMQWIDDFIARKNGERKIEYIHQAMKPAIENTYGVIVYQEQVMQISKEMCGFSGGQADTLRKAIGKKDPEVMKKLKNEFIEGAIKTVGADRPLMEKFWKELQDFAAYCFNKSHAACYAMIAYQTAYLKAHYPSAFMAALMTSDFDNIDRLAIEITECQHMGLDVLPPDVNQSYVEFSIVPNTKHIRFGMAAIKNVGTGAVEEILRARAEGDFTSLEDFLAKVSPRVVNRKTIESLIKAGALDSLADRFRLVNNLDLLVAYTARLHKQASDGQTDLFGNDSVLDAQRPKLVLEKPKDNPDQRQQLLWERELLGIYLSQHPLEAFEVLLSEQCQPIASLGQDDEAKTVSLGGSISSIREVTTKKGQKMAFVKLEDLSGELEVIIFPNLYQQTASIWERDRVVILTGKVSTQDRTGKSGGEIKLTADTARQLTIEQAKTYRPTTKEQKQLKQTVPPPAASMPGPGAKALKQKSRPNLPRVYIRLSSSQDQELLISLKQTLDQFSGSTEVVLILGDDESRQAIKLPNGINTDSLGLKKLEALVGGQNLKLQ